jgi:hypothetical protein
LETTRPDIPWPHAATLVLAADTPRQRRWAVTTAIDIVRKLAGQRPKVVLADIQMRTPSSLAATLGIEEGEGIVDVLFRGASFSAAAHRPEAESFYFLTIGTEPPPREVLLRHPRWQKIAAKLAETDAHLFPCVAADDWFESGPIPGFEPCIVLNATGEEIELPPGARRLAEFLAPPEIRQAENDAPELPHYAAGAAEEEPETESIPGAAARSSLEEAVEDTVEEIAGPAPEPPDFAAEPVPEWQEPEAEPEPQLEPERAPVAVEEVPPEARPKHMVIDDGFIPRSVTHPRRRRSVVPAIAVAVAAVAVVVLWRTVGVSGRSEPAGELQAAAETTEVAEPLATPAADSSASPGAAAAEEGEGAPPPEEGSRREEVSLPYSVAIASYSSFDDAVARQRDWTRRDTLFYVAPTVVRGVVYYRVFAGILHDRTQAESLMARLVEEGVKDSARDWDVRPARLAFHFGQYPSARDARSVVESLLSQGVPAYMVPAATGGTDGYHVYAGGYERAEDARPLRDQIERAGLEVELVERVGLEQL